MNFKIYDSIKNPINENWEDFFTVDQYFFPNPWSKDSWMSFLSTQDYFIVGYFLDLKLVGFSLFIKQVADSFAHLLKIVIQENLRGQKIGENLLLKSIDELEEIGVKKFFLEVETTNDAAIKLYDNCGFENIHCKKNFYGPNQDAFIMILEI
jgi:ribosomal-protein-alanine N-acetyltransferase